MGILGSIKEGGALAAIILFSGMVAAGCRITRFEAGSQSREISGLAKWSATQALCVHDAKADLEPNQPRLGMIDSSVPGGRYTEIKVAWPDGELAHDLEAICRIPGRPLEFLAAESGYWTSGVRQRSGRVFRLECRNDGDEVKARVAQAWNWPAGTSDIEGIACAIVEEQPLMFAATRGGTIFTAGLNFAARSDDTIQFVQANVLGEQIMPEFRRRVGDLHLDGRSDLWAVATVDSADQNAKWNDGPFRSAVYQVGIISKDVRAPITFHSSATNRFVIDGLKVEGLTESILGRGQFTIGSDDEDLGGVWRVIGDDN